MMGSRCRAKRKETYTSHGWLGSDNMSDWVATLEGLLLLDTFILQDEMLVSDVLILRDYMPRFLDLLRHTINRKEGNGMKTLKFHLMLHLWEDILKFGVPGNTDTEAGESNHKEIAKKTASRTQKRSKLLDWQTAHRYIENLTINMLHSREFQQSGEVQEERSDGTSLSNLEESEEDSNGTFAGEHGGWTHCFDEENIYLVPKSMQNPAGPTVGSFVDECGKANLFNDLRRFLTRKVAPHCQPSDYKHTCMFNCVKKDGIIYRAAPGRKPTRNLNVGWNDWAYVKWDTPIVDMMELEKTATGALCRRPRETGNPVIQEPPSGEYLLAHDNIIPAHLLCFVRFAGLKNGEFCLHGRTIRDGLYAVCHAVTQKQPEFCEDSLLIKHVMKDKRNDNFSDQNNMIMYLIPIANIVRPCICVPNIRGPQRQNDLHIDDAVPNRVDYLLIEPRERWPSIFLEHMKQENQKARRDWGVPWKEHNAKEPKQPNEKSTAVRLNNKTLGGRPAKRKQATLTKQMHRNKSSKVQTALAASDGNDDDSSDSDDDLATIEELKSARRKKNGS